MNAPIGERRSFGKKETEARSRGDISAHRQREPASAGDRRLRPIGNPNVYDTAYVIGRLEEAGATLLSLPNSGPRTALKTSAWPVVHTPAEGYGWSATRLHVAVPEAATITRMDEALGWIAAIPTENYVLRRIVGARALVSPLTGRHLFSWRRLGHILGADGRAVKRWHGKGIAMILEWLIAQYPGTAAAPSTAARVKARGPRVAGPHPSLAARNPTPRSRDQ